MYFEIITSILSFLKALLFGLTEPSDSCLNHLILWEPRGLFLAFSVPLFSSVRSSVRLNFLLCLLLFIYLHIHISLYLSHSLHINPETAGDRHMDSYLTQ